MTLAPPRQIEELESIRGLAALLVVFYHIPKWNPLLDIGIINNGYLMVELFFVLSGFVIFNAYAQRIDTGKDLIRFQFLRFGRLYPIHLLFLLLFVAIEIAKYVAVSHLGAEGIKVPAFQENSVVALIQQIFLLQAVGPTGNAHTFNDPAWSISVEFYTYLVFGLTVLLLKQMKMYVFATIIVVALLMLLTRTTYGFTNFLQCLAGFFIGCLTANLVARSRTKLPNYLPLLFTLAIISLVQLKPSKDYAAVYGLAVYLLTAGLIASLVLSKDGLLGRILKFRVLTWLGAISYSVYMSHSLVLWGVANVFKRLLKRPLVQGVDGKYVLALSTFETMAAVIAAVLTVVAISHITWSLIEKPMRERSRRFAAARLNS